MFEAGKSKQRSVFLECFRRYIYEREVLLGMRGLLLFFNDILPHLKKCRSEVVGFEDVEGEGGIVGAVEVVTGVEEEEGMGVAVEDRQRTMCLFGECW